MRLWFCCLVVAGFGLATVAAEPDKPVPPAKPDHQLKQPEVLKQTAPDLATVPLWVGKRPAKDNKELAGKVVLVHFWSSEAASSLDNLVYFAQWQKRFKDDGHLVIVGIHTCEGNQPFPVHGHDEDQPPPKDEQAALKKMTEKIAKVAKHNPAVVETGVDTDGELKQTWKVRHLPTFFLIDKKGNLRYRYEGFLEYQKLHNGKAMTDKIEELLKEEDK